MAGHVTKDELDSIGMTVEEAEIAGLTVAGGDDCCDFEHLFEEGEEEEESENEPDEELSDEVDELDDLNSLDDLDDLDEVDEVDEVEDLMLWTSIFSDGVMSNRRARFLRN